MGDYLDNNKPLGANVKRLLAFHSATVGVRRYGGGLAGGLEAIQNMSSVAREALGEVEQMLLAVKSAPDNPYGDDDEAIAGVIMQRAESKERP